MKVMAEAWVAMMPMAMAHQLDWLAPLRNSVADSLRRETHMP